MGQLTSYPPTPCPQFTCCQISSKESLPQSRGYNTSSHGSASCELPGHHIGPPYISPWSQVSHILVVAGQSSLGGKGVSILIPFGHLSYP